MLAVSYYHLRLPAMHINRRVRAEITMRLLAVVMSRLDYCIAMLAVVS